MASLGRNIAANYIGRTWTAVLSIILIPVYIRFMGVESYGLVGFFAALSSVLGILDLGIGATMNRELARRSVIEEQTGSQRDLVRTLEVVYWGISLLAGLIVIILAPYISSTWIKAQDLNPGLILRAVQLMGISLALQFPMSLYQGGLMGMQKQVLVNLILVITGTLRSGGVILLLWLISPTIQTYFAWQVVMSLIGSLTFLIAIWTNLPRAENPARFRRSIILDIWKYAAAISASALIGIILSQLDKVILSKMLSLKMFAYYSIAGTVASAIWMIIIPFNTAIFPKLVQLHEKKQTKELKVFFHQSSQLLSLTLLPISALLIVFARPILLLWIKDPLIVENAHLIVSLLVFGIMLNGIASLPANSAPAFGWPLLVTYTNLIQALFIIPLIVGMVYWLQGVGAAIAWVVMNSTYIIFMVPIFFRRYLKEENWKWYFNDIAIPMIVAFSVCLISWLIAPALQNPLVIFVWLALTGIMSFITTGLTLPYIRSLAAKRWIILLKHS